MYGGATLFTLRTEWIVIMSAVKRTAQGVNPSAGNEERVRIEAARLVRGASRVKGRIAPTKAQIRSEVKKRAATKIRAAAEAGAKANFKPADKFPGIKVETNRIPLFGGKRGDPRTFRSIKPTSVAAAKAPLDKLVAESATGKSQSRNRLTPDRTERQIRLVEAIASQLDTVDLDAVATSFTSIDAIAERMVASLPTVHPLDQDAGPFFDTTGLAKWLGSTRQALRRRVGNHDILAVKTADNRNLYPSFQFDVQGEPLPRLREVLPRLDPDDSDSWGSAIWLNAPAAEFEGRTPAEELRYGNPQKVIDTASRIAAAWAS